MEEDEEKPYSLRRSENREGNCYHLTLELQIPNHKLFSCCSSSPPRTISSIHRTADVRSGRDMRPSQTMNARPPSLTIWMQNVYLRAAAGRLPFLHRPSRYCIVWLRWKDSAYKRVESLYIRQDPFCLHQTRNRNGLPSSYAMSKSISEQDNSIFSEGPGIIHPETNRTGSACLSEMHAASIPRFSSRTFLWSDPNLKPGNH